MIQNNFSSYQRLGFGRIFGKVICFRTKSRCILRGFFGAAALCVVVFVSFGPGEFVLKVRYRWFAKTKMVMFQLFLLNSDLFQLGQ